MNSQITRLAVASLVLIVALILGTTYWQTWATAGLKDRQDNALAKVAQFKIDRGKIYARGLLVATNKPTKVKGQTFYFRRYPTRGLIAQTVGYSTQARSQSGLERTLNDYLTGSNTSLSAAFDRELDKLRGATVKGNNVVLTIDPRAQRLAMQLLGNRCGAVVALDPHTGAVKVLASSPTYDPNLVEAKNGYAKILKIRGSCGGSSALLNRATDGLFTPGSAFKMVTVSAALDSGKYRPDSTFFDPGYCTEYGKQVSNAGNPETGPEQFGNVNLVTAFQHSINSVFCNIGKSMGAGTILEYAKRFGFYSVPPLETPANERAPSGLYEHGRLFRPKDPAHQVDPGRLAFGQERMQVTPLQMAMVAAAIANGGRVMRPYVVDRIVAPNGARVTRTKPDELGRAIKPETAANVTAMMVAVVTAGTGTAAQIPGVQVAGKTGTAETGIAHTNTAWFVCFAPAQSPRYVVAVVLEKQHAFGGQVSAPIAKQVLQVLLRGA